MENIGAYTILEQLGDGGMGVVYKVQHKGAGTLLALKILKPELSSDPINIKRFQQELKTTSLLNHPNVVPIYDSGITEDGTPYFVMEFLDGCTLEEILSDEGFLDLDRFLHLFGQVCDALTLAHEKRVIHRDLKPSNIMVTVGDTGCELAKVLDFGIARVFQKASKSGTRLTQLGEVIGSPTYMSPEQCLSQKLDERSDVYSLGVVMYEALTGSPPFTGDSAVEILMGHLQTKPISPSKIRPDFNIPADLENLIFSCLEKESALRPANMQEVSAELTRISSSRKSRSFFHGLKQMPRRIKHRASRKMRQLAESRNVWLKPVAASLCIGAVGFFAYQHFQPKPTVESYITAARDEVLAGHYDMVAGVWNKAIALAKAERRPAEQLAALYERAADDVVTYAYQQAHVSSNYYSWAMLQPWPSNNDSNNTSVRAGLAKPFIEKALALRTDTADKIRLLDKLVSCAYNTNDAVGETNWLRQRIAITPTNTSSDSLGPNRRYGELLENSGRFGEAEEMWKKVLQLERLETNSPYPSALDHLADLYRSENKLELEEKMRREMVDDVREPDPSGNDYSYQLKEQLRKLGQCLKMQGKTAQAAATFAELVKVSKEKK